MASAAGTQGGIIRVRRPWIRRILFAVVVLIVVAGIYLLVRINRDSPVRCSNIEDSFKYGSTGGERLTGIPYSVWKALPRLFPELLPPGKFSPGQEYAPFGFLYEDGKDLPMGVSKRNYRGIQVVSFNCAICHVGSVRETPSSAPRYITGMPSNTVNLRAFYEFLFATAQSEKFAVGPIFAEIKNQGIHEDLMNRLILRFYAIGAMQSALISRRDRLKFILEEPKFGPGRIDTFNPPKALFNFHMENAPESEKFGVTDFPSIWNQRQREGMHLHWDGNNDSVQERNRSAAFGTGAYPPTLDRDYMSSIEEWLLDAKPPKYPYPIDTALAARGGKVYAELCAGCHGANGQEFHAHEGKLGQVTPIELIGTDRSRLDSYTEELAVNQSLLYAGYGDERFSHFRKTYGYANMPLDGIWLRAPYLHNGSVPSLRELLEPAKRRTRIFWRGYDVYDSVNVGFDLQLNVKEENRIGFRLDTAVRGNGNQGHEGKVYGTDLSDPDKKALVEYLKTF